MRDFSGASNLPELSQRLKPLMLRRYKMDVLKQLPPKFRSCKCLLDSGEASLERMRINELLNMNCVSNSISSNESLRVEDFGYEASNLVKYLGYEVNMDDPESKNKVMGLIATVRKETALLKVDVAADMLKDAILSEKIVVFAHHRDVIESLTQKFGKQAVCVYGGMKTEERANAVRRFQEDPTCRLFIGSIRAAGVGLTLTASSHVIFLGTLFILSVKFF
jgi:SWI/SNF-related matrix-associated actin-dependent regulator 1 of chromatin subfamily A